MPLSPMQEQENFDIYFSQYKGEPIALYGIGVHARRVLDQVKGYDFRLLVAKDHIGEFMLGRPIVALGEALRRVRIIIIAAGPSSTQEVYRRIRNALFPKTLVFGLSGRQLNRPDGLGHLQHSVQKPADRRFLDALAKCFPDEPWNGTGKHRRLLLANAAMLGKVCFTAITMRFLAFLLQQVRGQSDAAILFAARDGFFLHEQYAHLRKMLPDGKMLPSPRYFLTSRRAICCAMLKDEAGIRDFVHGMFMLDRRTRLKAYLEAICQTSFPANLDLSMQEAGKHWGMEGTLREVLRHKEAILAAARPRRESYERYIRTLDVEKYAKIYLVDLVTQGTIFFGLSRLLKQPVHLLAYATRSDMGTSYLDDASNRVSSLYGEISRSSRLFTLYFLLEQVYASRDGHLEGFDVGGRPIFDPSTCYSHVLLDEVQDAIRDFLGSDAGAIWHKDPVSRGFALSLLDLVHAEYSDMPETLVDRFQIHEHAEGLEQESVENNRMRWIRSQTI